MPTENRSSNTEMVSVPRETVAQASELLQEYNKCGIARELRQILALPAEQHHGEPVALPERKPWSGLLATADNLRGEGWNACLAEIAKLGPLYTRADPVALQRAWQAGYDTAWYSKNPADKRTSVNPYDPGEVERLSQIIRDLNDERDELGAEAVRLRAQLDEMTGYRNNGANEIIKLHDKLAELREGIAKHWKVVCDQRAQLAERDALLRDWVNSDDDMGKECSVEGTKDACRRYDDALARAKSALSASAEPSDQCGHSYANKAGCPECGEAFASAEPSEPTDQPGKCLDGGDCGIGGTCKWCPHSTVSPAQQPS